MNIDTSMLLLNAPTAHTSHSCIGTRRRKAACLRRTQPVVSHLLSSCTDRAADEQALPVPALCCCCRFLLCQPSVHPDPPFLCPHHGLVPILERFTGMSWTSWKGENAHQGEGMAGSGVLSLIDVCSPWYRGFYPVLHTRLYQSLSNDSLTSESTAA